MRWSAWGRGGGEALALWLCPIPPGTALLLGSVHVRLPQVSSKFCYLNKFGNHCLTTKLVSPKKT